MSDEPDERMFDLCISELAEGGFELEQGSLEPDRITLHPVQVRLLAEHAGLLPQPAPGLLDRLHARHIGRLHALYERLAEIRRFYLEEIVDHCGMEFALHLRALEDLVDEMLEDVRTADGDNNAAVVTPALPEEATECHDKSAAISVTPKRGRPKKDGALTPAERQRAHRERQAEPAATQQGALI